MRHDYDYDYEMHSPLNSPFHSDGLTSYATGPNPHMAKAEKRLVLHYIVNHSFQLLFGSFEDKFNLTVSDTVLVPLIQFTVTLFKRLQLSLVNFQKLLLLLNRYFTKLEPQQLQLSLKQITLALLIKIVGLQSTNWSTVTGLPLNTVHALVKFVNADLDVEDCEFATEELEMINDKMKTLIYSRFDVI